MRIIKPGHSLNLIICILSSLWIPVAADSPRALVLVADRVFDGTLMHKNVAVKIESDKVVAIGPLSSLNPETADVMQLGDMTLLPGFIELHSHITYGKVSQQMVLNHGITTARDLGGPAHAPIGGDGTLRLLTTGPILTAPNGYPIVTMGAENIAIAITSADHAKSVVKHLASQKVNAIKIALEPGYEPGAPWTSHHHQHPGHAAHPKPAQHHQEKPSGESHQQAARLHAHLSSEHHAENTSTWPLLPIATLRAIVEEAHGLNLQVIAHVGELKGVEIALAAGVDQWAHIPCTKIPQEILKKAVAQRTKIITTVDTLLRCDGVNENLKTLVQLGADLYYGAEIAHPDVPWGIDGHELSLLVQAGLSPLEVLHMATAKAGHLLQIPQLGTLTPSAPADLIAVQGNVGSNFKSFEYPGLVISGGRVVVKNF